MSAFVVLAVALAVMAVGVAAVVAGQLLRTVKGLNGALQQTAATLQPLLSELQEETAVSALESEQLQSRVAGLGEQRGEQSKARARRRSQRAALRGRRSEA